MNVNRKHKFVLAATASVLFFSLMTGGTLAWQSISQTALNENANKVNPGGRLHDDFNGTNKDVYVENFGDEDLIVRVKLTEYMEIKAGENDANPVIENTNRENRSTWHIHTPREDIAICEGGIHEYVTWKMGGQTTYLPTFNKNKDSLKADINGTFEGTHKEDSTHFDDYKVYDTNTPVMGSEITDADTNAEEEANPVEGINIHTRKNTFHSPLLTQDATVITMADWLKAETQGGKGGKSGCYWIYDEDGWAYWGEALKPNTATGLLLSGITMTKPLDDSWYYGVDVTAQFVTPDDIGQIDDTGFYDPADGKGPSENATVLLNRIVQSGAAGPTEPTTLPLKERILRNQQTAEDTAAGGNTNKTVTIDGVEFYVLKVQGDEALLMTKDGTEVLKNGFGKDNHWEGSDAQAACNRWIDGKENLKKVVKNHTFHVLANGDYTCEDFVQSSGQAFLLSDADITGLRNGLWDKNDPRDFTLGVGRLQVGKNVFDNDKHWYLRSPAGSDDFVAVISADVAADSGDGQMVLSAMTWKYDYNSESTPIYLRPAVIIDLSNPFVAGEK